MEDFMPTIGKIILDLAGWVCFLVLVYIIRNYIVMGFSLAVKEAFLNATEDRQRFLMQYLCNKRWTLKELEDHVRQSGASDSK